MTAPRIGVVLVTHNSSRWIPSTLESIGAQTVQPTKVLIVDDHSNDETRSLLDRWANSASSTSVTVQVMTSTATDQHSFTRIARNFAQGVRAMQDVDLVALSDHDDVWHRDRLEVQASHMREASSLFLASNGLIRDGNRTLFEAFDVPQGVGDWTPRHLLRHVLRHSVATGSASMLRPSVLTKSPRFVPPQGWLHDRWWSILAAAQSGLRVSLEPVIHYRLSADQAVGLSRGRQQKSGVRRVRSIGGKDLYKLASLHSLRNEAAPELRAEFSWGRLLKTLV